MVLPIDEILLRRFEDLVKDEAFDALDDTPLSTFETPDGFNNFISLIKALYGIRPITKVGVDLDAYFKLRYDGKWEHRRSS